jgi:very-short-patch-repair endonuclease
VPGPRPAPPRRGDGCPVRARSVGPARKTVPVTELPDPCHRLLRVQRGVIAAWQADRAGIAPARMRSLVRNGRWQQLHFGVYATFTGAVPRDAVMWAALLRAGPQSVLSHETAAEVSGLLDRRSRLLHVTVPEARRVRPVPGMVIHRSSNLIQARQPGVLPPRTLVEETVLDLAQQAASFDDVVALLARSCQRGLTTPFLLSEGLRLRAKSRWRTAIELALQDVADGVHSVLEFRYLRDVERAHGLPAAKRQATATLQRRLVYRDVRYRRYTLVVELDGQASHPDDQRWRDKHRDNATAVGGLHTLRYSWADVTERACETAAQVATVLARQGWPGPLRRCGPACRATRP